MLFIAFFVLLTLLIVIVIRGFKIHKMTMPPLIKYAGAGVGFGVIVTVAFTFIGCDGLSDDSFCGAVTLFYFGPMIVFAGLLIGIIIGYIRRKKKT